MKKQAILNIITDRFEFLNSKKLPLNKGEARKLADEVFKAIDNIDKFAALVRSEPSPFEGVIIKGGKDER